MKHKHIIAILIIAVCLVLAIQSARGNGRYGGQTPDTINDRPQTVRDIEDRADRKWATSTAHEWAREDAKYCGKHTRRWPEATVDYALCLTQRSNMRFLYMLRRGCVGVSTIASACKMEVK